MLRLLICGGRDFGKRPSKFGAMTTAEYAVVAARRKFERDFFNIKVNEFLECNDKHMLGRDCEIVSGLADGADTLAVDYAICNFKGLKEFAADWQTHKKAAGFIRNTEMKDYLLRFDERHVIAMPGGNGTAHMVKIARIAGIPVTQYFEADVDKYIAGLTKPG